MTLQYNKTKHNKMDIMPPIAPGEKIKIEIHNDRNNLITYITYPDMGYSKCKCTIYLIFLATLIAGIYYLFKTSFEDWKQTSSNEIEKLSEDSQTETSETKKPKTEKIQLEDDKQKTEADIGNKGDTHINSQLESGRDRNSSLSDPELGDSMNLQTGP